MMLIRLMRAPSTCLERELATAKKLAKNARCIFMQEQIISSMSRIVSVMISMLPPAVIIMRLLQEIILQEYHSETCCDAFTPKFQRHFYTHADWWLFSSLPHFYDGVLIKCFLHSSNSSTFAMNLVPERFGVKREVRCNSGAIPVAVSSCSCYVSHHNYAVQSAYHCRMKSTMGRCWTGSEPEDLPILIIHRKAFGWKAGGVYSFSYIPFC